MYYPIIKNKLNELKGLNDADPSLDFTPIIELTDNKYETIEKFLDMFTSKISNILCSKNVFIDIPTYVSINDVIEDFSLNNADTKYNFFLHIETYFKSKKFKEFSPVISFDYTYGNQRESYKENIKFVKKIINHFSTFAIRIFSDSSFKKDDIDLINQIYSFLGDEIQGKCTIIIDTDNHTVNEVIPVIKEITEEYSINQLIFAGEAFLIKNRSSTSYECSRINNHHFKRVKSFTQTFSDKDISVGSINYADYTLLDKIQSKIEIDPEKGFSYYPFIKYTTEDGNLCMFTADNKGDYEQYSELCIRIKKNIKHFSREHCTACAFIDDIALGIDGLKYKAGGTWKYRMISHHITSLAMLKV
jgi:hypothetical protein